MMQFPRMRLIAAPLRPFAAAGLVLCLGPGLSGRQAPAFAAQHTLEITVTNTGDTPLACNAALAHWFSEDLGEIAPGAELAISFGYDLPSGTIFRLNERGDEMAVERVWCGQSGASWASRAEVTLPREAGTAPAPIRLDCAATGAGTACTARPATAE